MVKLELVTVKEPPVEEGPVPPPPFAVKVESLTVRVPSLSTARPGLADPPSMVNPEMTAVTPGLTTNNWTVLFPFTATCSRRARGDGDVTGERDRRRQRDR